MPLLPALLGQSTSSPVDLLVVTAAVVAGMAAGLLILYVVWRLFLREWAEKRRSGR